MLGKMALAVDSPILWKRVLVLDGAELPAKAQIAKGVHCDLGFAAGCLPFPSVRSWFAAAGSAMEPMFSLARVARSRIATSVGIQGRTPENPGGTEWVVGNDCG
jgi:hypothetical protein